MLISNNDLGFLPPTMALANAVSLMPAEAAATAAEANALSAALNPASAIYPSGGERIAFLAGAACLVYGLVKRKPVVAVVGATAVGGATLHFAARTKFGVR
jgi:hypothetical protein